MARFGAMNVDRAAARLFLGEGMTRQEFIHCRADRRSRNARGIDRLRIEHDQIVEARLFSSDQNAEDAFWGR